MSLIVGAMAQVQHLRQHLGWDAVEFGMEAEIISAGPLRLMWNDNDWDNRHSRPDALPLRLPLYSIRGIETFDALIGQILLDLHNAWGDSWPGQASINWGKLVK
jgi:hypothetical protein